MLLEVGLRSVGRSGAGVAAAILVEVVGLDGGED